MIEPDVHDPEHIESIVDGLEEQQWSNAGREYMERMIDNGNQVIDNHYGESIIELIVPRGKTDQVDDIIEKWDLNPQGPNAMAQAPSFEEQQPEIAEGLSAWQFLLDDSSDLKSTGYDLENIIRDIQSDIGCPIMATKARQVDCSIPL